MNDGEPDQVSTSTTGSCGWRAGWSATARLRIIERVGHNPQFEQTAEVMKAVREFISADVPSA
jgi:pimeloyl-ACP methyl ester carboxylesterase